MTEGMKNLIRELHELRFVMKVNAFSGGGYTNYCQKRIAAIEAEIRTREEAK